MVRLGQPSRAYNSMPAFVSAAGTQLLLITNVMVLCVVHRFADHTGRPLPSASDISTIFNNVGPHTLCPYGSVRDVWAANSYGSLTVDSVVTGWIDISMTEADASCGLRCVYSSVLCLSEDCMQRDPSARDILSS